MLADEFCDRLLAHLRPTRELILEPGDPGPAPLTKVGGIPWWPTARPRPHCRDGHPMSFVFQVRLSDVPGLEACREGLLSFHYCLECSYGGNMSWGWEDPGAAAGYDVAILPVAYDAQVDGAGVIAGA